MLALSKSLGYLVRALTCLETGKCKTPFVRDIAECADVPPAYLAKLFTRLVEAGILESKRGMKGGTRLARPAAQISIYEVANAIEPDGWLDGCLLGLEPCDADRACPTHAFWSGEIKRIEKALRAISLADVIEFQRSRCAGAGARTATPGTAGTPADPAASAQTLV